MTDKRIDLRLYQANPNYILRHIAGKDVLIAIGAGVADFRGYISMNTTACYIWQIIQEKVTEEHIINCLYDKYDISKETIAKDVHELIELMISKKMVITFDE